MAKKNINKTCLSLDQAEDRGFIHRDYIAHCLRWTHVLKHLQKTYAEAVILDVGCGREAPLAKMLYSSRMTPMRYVGVDVVPHQAKVDQFFHTGKFKPRIHWGTDVCDLQWEGGPPTVVTCFEVLEHVEPAHCRAMLEKIHSLMSDESVFFMSTPCWNLRDCAGNHINEITFVALNALLLDLGFKISAAYGTFASQADIVPKMSEDVLGIYRKLREYYDSNFLSCVFAPLFPEHSRNALWVLRKGEARPGPRLPDVPGPWTSSPNWKELA